MTWGPYSVFPVVSSMLPMVHSKLLFVNSVLPVVNSKLLVVNTTFPAGNSAVDSLLSISFCLLSMPYLLLSVFPDWRTEEAFLA